MVAIFYISHCFGGGVKQYVDSFIEHYKKDKTIHIISIEKHWHPFYSYKMIHCNSEKIYNANSFCFHQTPDIIHINCLLPYTEQDIETIMNQNAKKYMTIHDLGMICKFQHDPLKTPCPIKLEQWKKICDYLTEIICVSSFVYNFMYQYTPIKHQHKLKIRQSPDIKMINNPLSSIYNIQDELRIACIGNINKWKGAEIISNVSKELTNKNSLIKIIVIGTCDGYSLSTGTYTPYTFNDKMRIIKPHILWYPNICDETYSYTLSIGIATNLPIFCTNKGSFIERGKNNTQITICNQNNVMFWIQTFDKSLQEYKKQNKFFDLREVSFEYKLKDQVYEM